MASPSVHPYRMHVSQKYLDLTKRKLELTRLPRDPQGSSDRWKVGVTKAELEPLVDYWSESYEWRAQEAYYNDTLPQFRINLKGTRLHFVHKQSPSPTAIPLLFIHGWPESFISVAHIIDSLCNPVATPPRGDENVQSFHVVAPSLPGFGFSDAVSEDNNNVQATATIMDALMRNLGYSQYIVHGSGWAFKVCRVLALAHSDSCIAVHTVNPDVPAPRSSYGYSHEDVHYSGSPMPSNTRPSTPVPNSPLPGERPQTTAYALADSPSGLLAYVLDTIQPRILSSQSTSPNSSLDPSSAQHSPAPGRSPLSSQAVDTPRMNVSPQHSRSPQSVPGLELSDLQNTWTLTALINWTMIHWLAGPEVALRWLNNSSALEGSLWSTHSTVPIGITHFRDPMIPGDGTGQTPPQWLEAYHRVAMVRRRDGRVRFAAWERPAEVVMDIRELAGILGMAVPSDDRMRGEIGGEPQFSPGSMLPSYHGGLVVPSQHGGQW